MAQATNRNPFADGLRTENGFLQSTMFKPYCSFGADASGSPTHITATGVSVGDQVMCALDVTSHTDRIADFERIVTVADQIQQSAVDLSAKVLVIFVLAQSSTTS